MLRLPFQSAKRQFPAIDVSAHRCWAAFRLAEAGATAIEFAMLAPLFIAPILAALQIGIVFLAKSELDQATIAVSRAVMTGQATTTSQVAATFCGSLSALINCNTLMINLTNYSALGSMQTANPVLTYKPDGTVSNVWSESFGSAGSIMVLQVVYPFPFVGGGLLPLAGQFNGTLPLYSTAVFVREE